MNELRDEQGADGEPSVADLAERHRKVIRSIELGLAARRLPGAGTILEVGAGDGSISNQLQSMGYLVRSIDLADGPYAGKEQRDVAYFDGRRIDHPDSSVDAIVSFHVLEHVQDLHHLSDEMARVLVGGTGVAVHVIPSSTWRLWTLITRYPLPLMTRLSRNRRPKPTPSSNFRPGAQGGATILKYLLPSRHGARGNGMTEVWHFSTPAWRRRFKACDWTVVSISSSRIFYSGTHLFGNHLSETPRRLLSRILGSSSRIWVVRPAGENGLKSRGDRSPQ